MYEKFFGLREKPFSILPDPDYMYWSRTHELAYAMLEYGIMNNAGITVITGEIGSGKTTLLRTLLNRIDDDVTVGMLTYPPDDATDLLEWILMAFGEPYEGKSPAGLYDQFCKFTIKQYEKGSRTLLIVDEAQNLTRDSLEKLRMLSNINADKDQLLQLILVGQPQLRDILCRPDMAQFAQRIAADFHLESLALEDVLAYISHRLTVAGAGKRRCFTFDACRKIHNLSRGIPRLVNILCDTSLIYCFARNATVVTADIVQEVVADRSDHGSVDFGAPPASDEPASRRSGSVTARILRSEDLTGRLGSDRRGGNAGHDSPSSKLRRR